MRKTEVQHNTQEQTLDYLGQALSVVEDLEPPDDLRAIAFSKAVDLIAAKQVFFEQVPAIADGILRRPN